MQCHACMQKSDNIWSALQTQQIVFHALFCSCTSPWCDSCHRKWEHSPILTSHYHSDLDKTTSLSTLVPCALKWWWRSPWSDTKVDSKMTNKQRKSIVSEVFKIEENLLALRDPLLENEKWKTDRNLILFSGGLAMSINIWNYSLLPLRASVCILGYVSYLLRGNYVLVKYVCFMWVSIFKHHVTGWRKYAC